MTVFHLEPSLGSLHGAFSSDLAPALTIASGDTVVYRTLDAGWNVEPRRSGGASDGTPKFPGVDAEELRGHCLAGPVAIAGAMPGMTLEIKVEEVRVGTWGWTSAGGWPHEVHRRLGFDKGSETFHLWSLDSDRGIGRNQLGHEVRLRPFMGVMGMAPAEPGRHSTVPPRTCGGNLDCKELVAGTSLFLPVEAVGGLFSVGDGHAAQGDGEVCVTAIECPMERVALTFFLHPEMRIESPRVRTPDAWMTLGLHEDLDEAAHRAVEAMVALIGELHGLPRGDAFALASLTVDLRVTQIVNQVKGVHAVLRDGAVVMPAG